MKGLVILALTFVAVWTVEGSSSKDSIVLRVFNKDFKVTSAKMDAMLKKANLEKHSYKLEVTNKMTRHPDSKTAEYTKTYYYYKVVPCNQAYQVEQDLDRLLRGSALGPGVARKALKDFKDLKIGDPNKTCKSGIEVHFQNEQYCGKIPDGDDVPVKRRASPCGSCGLCWRVVK